MDPRCHGTTRSTLSFSPSPSHPTNPVPHQRPAMVSKQLNTLISPSHSFHSTGLRQRASCCPKPTKLTVGSILPIKVASNTGLKRTTCLVAAAPQLEGVRRHVYSAVYGYAHVQYVQIDNRQNSDSLVDSISVNHSMAPSFKSSSVLLPSTRLPVGARALAAASSAAVTHSLSLLSCHHGLSFLDSFISLSVYPQLLFSDLCVPANIELSKCRPARQHRGGQLVE